MPHTPLRTVTFATSTGTDAQPLLARTDVRVRHSGIPTGLYCYDRSGRCPHWSIRKDRPVQENGYCALLNLGDWMPRGTPALWDQVKACGINEREDRTFVMRAIDQGRQYSRTRQHLQHQP